MKIVIDQGDGFSLSAQAMKYLADAQGVTLYLYQFGEGGDHLLRLSSEEAGKGEYEYLLTQDLGERVEESEFFDAVTRLPIFESWMVERDSEYLVKVVEEMGDAVNAFGSKLKVVEIPDDVEWEIGYEDLNWGANTIEFVQEKHRTWR